VLPHIKRQDSLGDFLVRVTCPCGASRHIEPEALARLVGRKKEQPAPMSSTAETKTPASSRAPSHQR
jgi:hypothetical protein